MKEHRNKIAQSKKCQISNSPSTADVKGDLPVGDASLVVGESHGPTIDHLGHVNETRMPLAAWQQLMTEAPETGAAPAAALQKREEK
jgi:hypothetical protein